MRTIEGQQCVRVEHLHNNVVVVFLSPVSLPVEHGQFVVGRTKELLQSKASRTVRSQAATSSHCAGHCIQQESICGRGSAEGSRSLRNLHRCGLGWSSGFPFPLGSGFIYSK